MVLWELLHPSQHQSRGSSLRRKWYESALIFHALCRQRGKGSGLCWAGHRHCTPAAASVSDRGTHSFTRFSPPSPSLLNHLSLPQKPLLFKHCKNTLCTLNRTLEGKALRQVPAAKAGREQLALAARSGSGGGKPHSAFRDQPPCSPRAGRVLPGPCLQLGLPVPAGGHRILGTCVWQGPACHTWVSAPAASPLLACRASCFYGFGVPPMPCF